MKQPSTQTKLLLGTYVLLPVLAFTLFVVFSLAGTPQQAQGHAAATATPDFIACETGVTVGLMTAAQMEYSMQRPHEMGEFLRQMQGGIPTSTCQALRDVYEATEAETFGAVTIQWQPNRGLFEICAEDQCAFYTTSGAAK